jgi:hypothetical protein
MSRSPVLAWVACGVGTGLLCACSQEQQESSASVVTYVSTQPAQVASAEGEVARLQAQVEDLRSRLVQAESALQAETERRLAREKEWLEYTSGIAKMESLAQGLPKFAVDPAVQPKPEPSTSETDKPEPDKPETNAVPPSQADVTAVTRRLRTLLSAEQVAGVDVMELGNVQADHVGPVVLRILDANGRLLSVLAADRLRLECSRAGRSVTLVLEHGYERRNGEKLAFTGGAVDADGRGGVRTIVIPDCDPRPWLEGLPFLFRPEALEPVPHDGSISVESLRAALNVKLREDQLIGHWRVDGIGGVQRSVLYEVAFSQLDEKGNIVRTLVADKATFAALSKGVEVLLEGGAQVKVDSTVPFLDGRYRLVLPRADAEAWRAARIPLLE